MKSGRNNALNKRQATTYTIISNNGFSPDLYPEDLYNSKCFCQKLAKILNKREKAAYRKSKVKYKAIKY